MQENNQNPSTQDNSVYEKILNFELLNLQNKGQGDFTSLTRRERLKLPSAEEKERRNKKVETNRRGKGKRNR